MEGRNVFYLSVWLSGRVTLRRARLVPARVTVLGRVNHLGAERTSTQVNSA